MQSPPRSPFELSAVLRILCALVAASTIFGVVVAPFTDRLRVFGNVTLCGADFLRGLWASYSTQSHVVRVVVANLLGVFVIVVQQYHHL
jgi:4-hydroxybenzoate polyprenyltransferase